MTTKKRTTKKTAAAPKVEQSKELVPSSGQEVDLLGEFPLPEGHYFYNTPVVSPLAHDGTPATLQAVQRIVGAAESGQFDDGTATAVRLWKTAHGLEDSPVLDAATWDALRKG